MVYKSLLISNCLHCINLRYNFKHKHYVCEKMGTIVQPELGIPKECPLETIEDKEQYNV